MELILYAVLFLALVWGILLVMLMHRLDNVRMQRADTVLKDAAELPEGLAPLFDAHEPEFSALGFEFSHCQISTEVFATVHPRRWVKVYLNRQHAVAAVVAPSLIPDAGNPCSVDFITIFDTGERIHTMNGLAHGILGNLPRTVVNDPYAETVEQQWASHLKKVGGMGKGRTAVLPDPERFVEQETALKNDYIDALLQKRRIADAGDGTFRIRSLAALPLALKILTGMSKATNLAARRINRAKRLPPAPLPVDVEAAAFERTADFERSRAGRGMREMLIFLGSLLLFSFSFGIGLSPQYLLILLVAISLHEAGHLLGMSLFRYEDVKLLYLPFMGAATIGIPKQVRPFQKVIVSLLGPVPGILLGIFILSVPGVYETPPAAEFAYGMLLLNYLNLLPIMPFDGGHVFQNTIFLRFPVLQMIFWIGSGILLAGLAVALDAPLFIGIAVFLLLGAVPQFRNSRALHLLHQRTGSRNPGPDSDQAVLREVFLVLREKPFNNLTFQKKYQIAKFLRDNAGGGIPSLATIFLAVGLYCVVFVVPLAVIVLPFISVIQHGYR